MYPSLLDLPNELLYRICTLLDREPPSQERFNNLPCFSWTQSSDADLKSVSETSTRLRHCVLPLLFKHAQFSTHDLTEFLDFVDGHNLRRDILSIVAVVIEPCAASHPAWYTRVLNDIRPLTLTICCDPTTYRALAAFGEVETSDDWAFRMPCQLLELCQTPDVAALDISYDEPMPGLIDAKPWSSMKFNEGSSIAAYTTFEYFFKRPPSLMLDIYAYLKNPTVELIHDFNKSIGSYTSKIMAEPVRIRNVMGTLRDFSYIATFPFYNNFDHVLACVRDMVNLRKLSIQLCSDPNSGVLDEEIQAAGFHLDINDPWNEAVTAYNLLPHTVAFLHGTGSLEMVISEDTRIEAIKEAIVSSFSTTLRHRWVYDGDKTWSKIQPAELCA